MYKPVINTIGIVLITLGSLFSRDVKISPGLEVRLRSSASEPIHTWIYFSDKNLSKKDSAIMLGGVLSGMDPQTLWRRSKSRSGDMVDVRDLPVSGDYIHQVIKSGARLRATSKWLNAVSISATPEMILQISELPFVKKLDVVYGGKRIEPDISTDDLYFSNPRTDYGNSFDQLDQINVIEAHESGYAGQGIIVLMLDTGFYTDHQAIHEDQIIAEWDFINNDGETQNEPGDPDNAHNHGTYTLSALGGSFEGQLYGPAYNAQFLLAKTEDVSQEVPIEEDWYVAGLEWGESLGADVASSSLGYIDWYTIDDLDGETAVTTIAVNTAIENGMVIATAAGNAGPEGIIAPADAFDVLTCGAVNGDGEIAGFSSRGPTADGRIKPDVCARGVATWCAVSGSPDSYDGVSGTSLSTPLIGGVAAVILSARPSWTPIMVKEALTSTASNAANPDNLYGWGIINVMAAIHFFDASGDVNNDGLLDILDVVTTINFILGVLQPDEGQLSAGDINQDGILDILDIVEIVSIIVGVGPE